MKYSVILTIAIVQITLLSCTKKITENNNTKNSTFTEMPKTIEDVSLLNGRKFMIVEINDTLISFDSENKKDKYIVYFYEKGRFSAMAGCNTLGGSYEQSEGNTISFSKILSTMMVCEDMKAERSFSTALAKVNNFTINDNVLALRSTTKILVKLQEIK